MVSSETALCNIKQVSFFFPGQNNRTNLTIFFLNRCFIIPLHSNCLLSGFSSLKPGKTMKISPKKNHVIYCIIVLSYHGIYPENIAQFLIFYRTLSDGLIL